MMRSIRAALPALLAIGLLALGPTYYESEYRWSGYAGSGGFL